MEKMTKLLIADDEVIIRTGLKKSLEWSKWNIEIIGLAEHGDEAVELAKNHGVDMALVDINMPIMNGIELIHELKKVNPEVVIVIITGYDEFEYAREAIRLEVFEYLLKPISKKVLRAVIERCIETIHTKKSKNELSNWAKVKLEQSRDSLIDEFILEWIQGKLSETEAREQRKILSFPMSEQMGLILIKPIKIINSKRKKNDLGTELLRFSIMNIASEILGECRQKIVSDIKGKHILLILEVENQLEISELVHKLQEAINYFIKYDTMVSYQYFEHGYKAFVEKYKKICKNLDEEMEKSPIIISFQSYVSHNFHRKNLSLDDVANSLKIHPQYLGRLIKNELGYTYKEYLIQVRMERAIELLHNPTMRIYEVADSVGYKSQHYFCAAFKKIKGVSPNDFRAKANR